MTLTHIGYARYSTNKQDLSAQQAILEALEVAPDRIYMDRGFTGTMRAHPPQVCLLTRAVKSRKVFPNPTFRI